MNYTDLLEITDLYQELTGDAYWYVVKDSLGLPFEIWPLPPDRIRIIPDEQNYIRGYRYKWGGKKVDFDVDEIIQFKWPNPNDLLYGMSPVEGAAGAYNTNVNMNKFENALFTNNARIEGYFTTKEELDDTTFDRVKDEILDTYANIMNAGKPGFFEGGVEYKPLSLNPRELSFLKGREWTKTEIYEAFGNPQGLFSDKANRANAEAAQFIYLKLTISPRLKRFEEKLNEKLAPMFGENIFFAFDNIVPEDKEFQLKERESNLTIGLTDRNEERIKIGLEPQEHADGLLVPGNIIPIERAANPDVLSEEPVKLLIENVRRRLYARV